MKSKLSMAASGLLFFLAVAFLPAGLQAQVREADVQVKGLT